MSADAQIRCLLCGGRGGWWSGEFREQCTRCQQTGWEPNPSPALIALCAPYQADDGFTPDDEA